VSRNQFRRASLAISAASQTAEAALKAELATDAAKHHELLAARIAARVRSSTLSVHAAPMQLSYNYVVPTGDGDDVVDEEDDVYDISDDASSESFDEVSSADNDVLQDVQNLGLGMRAGSKWLGENVEKLGAPEAEPGRNEETGSAPAARGSLTHGGQVLASNHGGQAARLASYVSSVDSEKSSNDDSASG
jgi:hypothetical protein